MSKKALLSVLLIGVLAFGAGLGTFAWFTSTATSTDNVFTAGTIKLATEGEETIEIALNTDNIQPGDVLTGDGVSEYATITIENDGTLPMATFGRFTLGGDSEELAKDIKITDYKVEFYNADGTKKDRVDNFIDDGIKSNPQFALNMYDWVNGNGPLDCPGTPWDIEALKKDEYFTISFRLVYDELAEVQGQEVDFGYKVLGAQVNLDALNALKATNSDLSGVIMENHIQYLTNQVN